MALAVEGMGVAVGASVADACGALGVSGAAEADGAALAAAGESVALAGGGWVRLGRTVGVLVAGTGLQAASHTAMHSHTARKVDGRRKA